MSYSLKGEMLSGSINGKQSLEGNGYPRGNDGISPTVEVSENEDGHVVAITDVYGKKEFEVKDGRDGEPGYTPIKNVDYFDGEDGAPGRDGTSVTHRWEGTTLVVTSASGTSSADLKGENGRDYVLTEADKEEIAGKAAELVEIPVIDNLFIVNAEEDDIYSPPRYSADKTSQEIYEAWMADKIIVCKYIMSGFPVELTPSFSIPGVAVFSNTVIVDDKNIHISLVIQEDSVHVFYSKVATTDYVDAKVEAGGSGGSGGADGFSPVANVAQTSTGAVITITDKTGTTTATVANGKDGKDGIDGKDGEPGAKGDNGDPGKPVFYLNKNNSEFKPVVGKTNSFQIDTLTPANRANEIAKGDFIIASKGFVFEVTYAGQGMVEALCISDINGPKGDQGIQGEPGKDGADGQPGKDGADGAPGKDGTNGKDGVSVTHSWNGTTLTISSASGTSSADLKGDPGKNGKDGASPSITIEETASGVMIEAINPDGTQQIGYVLNGEKGNPGTNGTSVTVSNVSESSASGGTNTVTFSDGKKVNIKNGVNGTNGTNGKDGKTPVRGTDYWTTADQEAIVQQVITALGTPVFGRVDADNNIILTGELADGTYTIKYEDADGEQTVIGTLYAEGEPVVEPARYGIDYGQYKRVGGEDNRVYYDNLAGQSNYLAIYQENGDAPLHADSTITTKSNYHPLVVPDGKTKVKVTFPNIGSDKLFMSVPSLSLSNEVYTRTANSGWLTEGVYEYTFGTNVKYIGLYFRNSAYTHINTSITSGFTVEWL